MSFSLKSRNSAVGVRWFEVFDRLPLVRRDPANQSLEHKEQDVCIGGFAAMLLSPAAGALARPWCLVIRKLGPSLVGVKESGEMGAVTCRACQKHETHFRKGKNY